MTTKRCSRCKETKPVDGFNRHRRAKDGLYPQCRECRREAAAAYRAANPDKVKATNVAWYAANLDKERARSAAWRAANPDKAKAVKAAYRAANPDKERARGAAYLAGGRDPNKPWPPGPIGYMAAHRRVVVTYGPAKNHDCKHCGGPAVEWAYGYNDPGEFSGPMVDTRNGSVRVMRWSGRPQHYMPLCQRCHNTYDKSKKKGSDQ